MMWMALTGAYLVGAIPTSIIVCRILKGVDIRTLGSGNAGATNVLRILGWKVALFVLIVDALKGVAGVLLPVWLVPGTGLGLRMAAGFLAIAGHVWTVFAGFRGGKGVGAALGVFLALVPIPSLLALGSFIAVVVKWRIVSLASLTAAAVLSLSTQALYVLGKMPEGKPLVYFTLGIVGLVFFTHRQNIQRLRQGTEKKIQFTSKEPNP